MHDGLSTSEHIHMFICYSEPEKNFSGKQNWHIDETAVRSCEHGLVGNKADYVKNNHPVQSQKIENLLNHSKVEADLMKLLRSAGKPERGRI